MSMQPKSLWQAEQCWRDKAEPLAFAKDHEEFRRAYQSFPHDADAPYPSWRQTLRINSAA